MFCRLSLGISESQLCESALMEEVEERGGEFVARRRPKTDGVSLASPDCSSIMAPTGWQVEHVSRLENHLLGGSKIGDQSKGRGLHQREGPRAWPHQTPASTARALQEEDVVRIDVRPNSSL